MRPAKVIVLYVEVLFTRSTFIIKRNDVLLGRHPVVGEDTAVCVYYSEHIRQLLAILAFQRTTLYDEPVWLSFYQAVYADGCDIAFLIANLNVFPFLQLLEILVATAAVGSTNVERVAALLYGLDDFLWERPAVSTETLYYHTKFWGYTIHNATERVLLMEFHIGVSVTVLTSDYDSPMEAQPGK